ncbi:MAG: Xaa-Pro aminopeptidase [Gammaproteobacteria bacterium]|nr:MAG: Xaa-Pro aminopeptidase [Gammaproteobacteria bacterium]
MNHINNSQQLAQTLLPLSEFITRRDNFFAQMPENSIAIFKAASEVTRSNDTEYAFCQNKNFYYLTGFNEPDALLVMIKGEYNQAFIFCRDKDPLTEIWQGRRIGTSKAKTNYGFDDSFIIEEIGGSLPELIKNKEHLLYCQGENQAFDMQVMAWLTQVKKSVKQGAKAPTNSIDCAAIVHELRLIKSDSEIAIMRQGNKISCGAHQRAMQKTSAGKFEYQIEAELLHEFTRHGARHAAYASIVAGGDNANILHYTDNNDTLKNNDLLLIDAGAELAGYAADITRTFPVNGKFSVEQKALYELVLKSQNAAINEVKIGNTFAVLNVLVNEILTQGLIELGILTGDLTTLIKEKACKKYFIHGLGHWLGLDVHDVGDYQVNTEKQQCRKFEVGMVMTIEPGLYIPLDDDSVDKKWRGIGIRIEDNILVTEPAITHSGYENLTAAAVKSVADIEKQCIK